LSEFDSGHGPNTFAPKPRFDYVAPSAVSRYRILAIIFVLVIVAAAVYLIMAPRKPLRFDPPSEPVYIEAVKPEPNPNPVREVSPAPVPKPQH
jgi:hypothetical protein